MHPPPILVIFMYIQVEMIGISTRNQPAGLVGRRSARFWTPTDQGKPAEIILYPRWWLSNGTNHWPGVNQPYFRVGRSTDGRVPGGAHSVWHAGLTKLPIVSMFFSRLGPIGAGPGFIQANLYKFAWCIMRIRMMVHLAIRKMDFKIRKMSCEFSNLRIRHLYAILMLKMRIHKL